jgi:hypothetical protein
MLKRILCAFLAIALQSCLMIPARAVAPANRAAELKTGLKKLGTGEKTQIKVKLADGSKISGYLSRIGENDFEVTDSKNGKTTPVLYSNVVKAKAKNGGEKFGFWGALGLVWLGLATIALIFSD